MNILTWLKGLFRKETTMQLTVNGPTALAVGATVVVTASEAATFSVSDSSILQLVADASGTTATATAIAQGVATVSAVSAADPTASTGFDFTVTAAPAAVSPDTSALSAAVSQAAAAPASTVAKDPDALLAKLKDALVFAGHDVEAVWDEALALAKKLV